MALHSRTHSGVLSSVIILVVSYLALAVMGPIVGGAVSAGSGVSAGLVLAAPQEQETYLLLVMAAGATVLGAGLYSLVRPLQTPQPDPLRTTIASSQKVRVTAGILSLIPFALAVLGQGAGLLYRDDYIPPQTLGNPILIAAQTLALPAVAVLGWLIQNSRSAFSRSLGLGALALYAGMLFSLATRGLALMPLALALGMMAAAPMKRRMALILFAAGIASVLLLPVPLALRWSPHHGLVPYAQVIAQGIVSIDLTSLASNVLFAYQLTGQVAFVVSRLDLSTLLVSLDPRPSGLTVWYTVEPTLRVNLYTPYNALGTLANYGWPVMVAFFLIVGAYLGHLDARVKRLLSQGQGLAALLLFGLACLFIVTTLQYDLRSCVRILYYAAGLEVAITMFTRVAQHSSNQLSRPVAPTLEFRAAGDPTAGSADIQSTRSLHNRRT
jgi:hypothetical protein